MNWHWTNRPAMLGILGRNAILAVNSDCVLRHFRPVGAIAAEYFILAGRCLLVLILMSVIRIEAAEVNLKFIAASSAALGNPHDLKLSPDGKFLFVADVDNDRVAILDPVSLDLLASFGADHQGGTHDVDFDQQGRAYIADTHNNRVTIYRIDGTDAELIGELSDHIRGPEGVLAHPNGRIYVAGAWSGNVVAYQDGQLVAELDGLSSPHDLELAANGDIYLADAGNSRILTLTPALAVKSELSRQRYDFDGVRYLDLTDDGILIAADKNNHQVKFISPRGDLLHVLGDGKASKGAYQLRTPEGVELRGNSLWISDSGNDRVIRYEMTVE